MNKKTGPEKPSDFQKIQEEDRIRQLVAKIRQKEEEIQSLRQQIEKKQVKFTGPSTDEMHEKIDLLMRATQIGIWEWEIQTGVILWDERTKSVFGFSDQEFDGSMKSYQQRIHPADLPRMQEIIQEAVERKTTYQVEHRVIWPDQQIRYVIGHGVVIRNEKGEAVKVIGTCQDFTDLQIKNEKLKRFGKLLESAYSEIYILDAQTLTFLEVNLGGRINLGYTQEELTQKTLLDIIPGYAENTIRQLIQSLYDKTPEEVSFESNFLRKNGSFYHVLAHLQLSADEDRRVVIANVQDITEEVLVKKQLQKNKMRLDLAIQGTSDGIWDWPDMKSNRMWWSPKFYELLGIPEFSVDATMENFQKLIHPEDKETFMEQMLKHVKQDQPYDIEIRLKHQNGHYRWFRSRGQIFRNEKGNPVRMAGAISDIHMRKKAEFQLKNTNLRLQKTNEYLDNFVFTVAHDLRSPVANLKSLVALFKAQVDQYDPIVSRIDLSVERLEQTLRGLVQILDVQKSKQKAIKSVSFSQMLDKLKKEMEETIHETQVVIRSDFKIAHISYFEPYLESMMRNLLSNALKYTRSRDNPVIILSTEKHQEFVTLRVTDNGIGIDLERFKHKIFKPFEKISPNSSGQGVGLHLIKTMVEKNGGKVEVQSKLEEGTTFTVFLKPYSKNEK